MNSRRFLNLLSAAAMVAGGLCFGGLGGGTAQAQSLKASCADMAMMNDGKMGDPNMMADSAKMGDPNMMSDSAMTDDHAMMGNMALRAKDGQCLAIQSAAIQSAFYGVFGERAGARWVQEHEAEVAKMGM